MSRGRKGEGRRGGRRRKRWEEEEEGLGSEKLIAVACDCDAKRVIPGRAAVDLPTERGRLHFT